MNSKISFATTTLSYPVFAADFDPYGRGYLIVGGGGGESKTGVPNQITVLDIYNQAILLTVAEIELSSDEDSVQSLASLATKDGLIAFAGINSSQADQDAGKNQHFRSFDIKIPPRKKQTLNEALVQKGSSTPIGKTSLFKPTLAKRKEAYQRILRLSPAKREAGSRRIGAVATGMSKPAEIVVFNATKALPEESDILARIQTDKEDDVLDLDIAIADQDRFSIAWCTDYDLHEQTFDYDFASKKVQKTPKGPRRIYQIATPDSTSKETARPKFRCLRFLDPQNILALVNLPSKKGAELRVYHLYPTGPASTTFQMQLPSHIKQAVSMDICAFDSDANGNRQILIAVAAQDISITTWLVDYKAASDTFSKFNHYQTVRNVHKHQMTKICFAPFHAPPHSDDKAPPEQFAKLASVSYGNSVVVDTFPLMQISAKDPKSRFVLEHPDSHNRTRNLYIVVFSFVALVTAYIAQGYFGGSPTFGLQVQQYLPGAWKGFSNSSTSTVIDVGKQMEASAASIIERSLPTDLPGGQTLQELVDQHSDSGKAVVIKGGSEGSDLAVDVHHDKEEYLASDPHAKHWDELHETQKSYWRQRLQEAGHWAESEGESVFKGVLWSQWAGLVGDAAGEILREL